MDKYREFHNSNIYLIQAQQYIPHECHWRGSHYYPALGTVSRKPRKLFWPIKPFLVHPYLNCIHLKLLV